MTGRPLRTETQPVVVGFDGSQAAARAVEVAADEAGRRGTSLVVLVVAGSSHLWSDSVEELYGDARAALRWATATSAMRRCARPRSGVPSCWSMRWSVRSWSRRRSLRLGDRAQLLVLGGRGRRGQMCLQAGATSAELALAFGCPVLVTHHRASPARERSGGSQRFRDRPTRWAGSRGGGRPGELGRRAHGGGQRMPPPRPGPRRGPRSGHVADGSAASGRQMLGGCSTTP